jgi:hypothetical protein
MTKITNASKLLMRNFEGGGHHLEILAMDRVMKLKLTVES